MDFTLSTSWRIVRSMRNGLTFLKLLLFNLLTKKNYESDRTLDSTSSSPFFLLKEELLFLESEETALVGEGFDESVTTFVESMPRVVVSIG